MRRYILQETGYDPTAVLEDGNKFLLGNGRLGYRGTLEEEGKDSKVALNVVGTYDRHGDAWRESLNAPNPFKEVLFFKDKEISVKTSSPISHKRLLNLHQGLLSRRTVFPEAVILTERFVDKINPDCLSLRLVVVARQPGLFSLESTMDTDIWDINGPHLTTLVLNTNPGGGVSYLGKTNEGAYLAESVLINSRTLGKPLRRAKEAGWRFDVELRPKERIEITVSSAVLFSQEPAVIDQSKKVLLNYLKNSFKIRKQKQVKAWEQTWAASDVEIYGSHEADFALTYSIYQLLSLAPTKYITSIPARGLSGQTYKGAVFWDTEMFMLPFFLMTDITVATNLVRYRINTLPGALRKAKRFGYQGAFFAWESQETGDEACSLYNVSDAVTGKPIRTYFADKQIHVSGDVAWGLLSLYDVTKDDRFMLDGGLELLFRVAEFYVSYSTKGKDGLFHLDDVIGPDEYHERVNDNAFTNILVERVLKKTVVLASKMKKSYPKEYDVICSKVSPFSPSRIPLFLQQLYVPKPREDGVIEQFAGYYQKENVSLSTIRSRLKTPNEYWGGEHGVAASTQIIKQADVVTALSLFPNAFPLWVKKANFDFYEPRTEHGSSLSACMHSLLASAIGDLETAYRFFINSASLDLIGGGKQYAGGIYIGGIHPAASGGAYLSVVWGFAGLRRQQKHIRFSPHLPKNLKRLRLRFVEDGILKEARIGHRKVTIRKVI